MRQSCRFELKNFPGGNLISSTGFSIALQARVKPVKWLPELLRVCFKPKLISERVLTAETFNQEEQVINAQNPNKKQANEIRITGRGMVIRTRASGVVPGVNEHGN